MYPGERRYVDGRDFLRRMAPDLPDLGIQDVADILHVSYQCAHRRIRKMLRDGTLVTIGRARYRILATVP